MMNGLRCLMNSSAVWLGSNSRWTALVTLRANNKIYAFVLSFLDFVYLERGDPSVLSVFNFFAVGCEKAVTWNFLHP